MKLSKLHDFKIEIIPVCETSEFWSRKFCQWMKEYSINAQRDPVSNQEDGECADQRPQICREKSHDWHKSTESRCYNLKVVFDIMGCEDSKEHGSWLRDTIMMSCSSRTPLGHPCWGVIGIAMHETIAKATTLALVIVIRLKLSWERTSTYRVVWLCDSDHDDAMWASIRVWLKRLGNWVGNESRECQQDNEQMKLAESW